MARQITIPITDTPDCVEYYIVEWRLAGEAGYTNSFNSYTAPIVITNLLDNTEYDFRITRVCCNGVSSTPVEVTLSSDATPAPAMLNLAQDGADVDAIWSSVTDADQYQLQRADDSGFTTNLTDVYSGASTSVTDASPGGGTLWYRVRARKPAFPWSAWVSNSITLV